MHCSTRKTLGICSMSFMSQTTVSGFRKPGTVPLSRRFDWWSEHRPNNCLLMSIAVQSCLAANNVLLQHSFIHGSLVPENCKKFIFLTCIINTVKENHLNNKIIVGLGFPNIGICRCLEDWGSLYHFP